MDGDQCALLEVAATNAVLVPGHVGSLLKIEAGGGADRLDDLVAVGLLKREWLLADAPACYRITQAGLDAVGSGLPVPVFDVGRLRHEIGVTWLWLAARSGALGQAEWVRSRRELTALGEADDADLVLSVTVGWVAVHLELVLPERAWLERTLRRYGSDPRFAAVLFAVETHEARELVKSVAADLGLSEMTHVQRVAEISG